MSLQDPENVEKIVLLLYKQYCNEIFEIPQIEVITGKLSSWAQFKVYDLYKKRYRLYVDPELLESAADFIKAIIFHECTHLLDSLQFVSYPEYDFIEIMKIYSETHASQIMLEQMISCNNCSKLEDSITYNLSLLSIRYFMDQSIDKIANQINRLFDASNIIPVEDNDITYAVYYFSGYLLALKNKDIEYTPNFSNIPDKYKSLIIEIVEYLSSVQCKEYNIAKIQDYHNTLSLLIEEDNKVIQERYDNLVKQVIADNEADKTRQRVEEEEKNTIKCPKCGSTQITTGQKGYSLITGFLGSNKTVNRCANCGYSWKPGK